MDDTLAKVELVIETIQAHFAQERWARDRITYFQREGSRLASIGDPRLRQQRAVEVDRAAEEALRTMEGLLTPTEPGGVVDLRGARLGDAPAAEAPKPILLGMGVRELIAAGSVIAAAGAAAWLAWGKPLGAKTPDGAGSADGVRMTKVAMFGGTGYAPRPNPFLPAHNPYLRKGREEAAEPAEPDDDEPYS